MLLVFFPLYQTKTQHSTTALCFWGTPAKAKNRYPSSFRPILLCLILIIGSQITAIVPYDNHKLKDMKKKIILMLALLSISGLLKAQDDEKGPVRPLSSYFTPVTILDNFNSGGVATNPTVAMTFTIPVSYLITTVQTYHWNYGRGTTTPGTIKLIHSNGTVYGPWATTGSPGSGGVRNAFWTASPNMAIPSGTYTVVVSDNVSWSCNTQSGNKGFVKLMGKR
jgi:hypothetical protein